MRTPFVLTLVLLLAACGSDRRHDPAKHDAPAASTMSGPDPVVLRIPRGGGKARAFVYPRLDSLVWTSSGTVPAPAAVLAFDDAAGVVAFEDDKGRPGRLDLRSGAVSTTGKPPLTGLVSSDGSTIYGLAAGGITRLTSTGTWSFKPPRAPRAVFPQPDGSLLVSARRDSGLVLWKVRPPDDRLADSVVLAGASRRVAATADRLYFTTSAGTGLMSVRPRDLEKGALVTLETPLRAVVATPSGDRLYVVSDSSTALSVVDRYADRVRDEVELPGQPSDLRMDPLGRYLLVRAARGDSAWVVAIGTDRVIGAVRTRWLDDLPAVAPDGLLLLARGADAVFVDAATLATRRTIEKGANDYWYFTSWNGFRPRAAGLDEPVTFQESAPDSGIWGVPMDTTARDSGAAAPVTEAPPDTARRAAASTEGWTVSFAALLAEDKARELASRIQVNGQRARIMTSTRTGTPVYRVVLGPYPSKAEAEHVGQESGQSYWVFQGTP